MKRLLSGLTTACLLLFSLNISAFDPGVCDPEEHPTQCKCDSSGEYDVCYDELHVEDLDSLEDPSAIRELANIQTSWNDEEEVYEVLVDTSGLSGGGVLLPDYAHNGTWESKEELHEYLSKLLGVELAPTDYDEDGVADFPPLRIRQNGKVAIFDSKNATWAPALSGNLIWDAITALDGTLELEFEGVIFDILPVGRECNGVIEDGSEDRPLIRDSNAEIGASQCSAAIRQECTGSDEECSFFEDFVQTRLDTRDRITFGNTISCVGLKSGQTPVCELEKGFFVIERHADLLSVRSIDWNDGKVVDNNLSYPTTDTDAPSLTQTGESPTDATCAEGKVKENGARLFIRTRDASPEGAWDDRYSFCYP